MTIGNEGETVRGILAVNAYGEYRRAVDAGAPHEEVMKLLRAWLALDNGTADYADIRS